MLVARIQDVPDLEIIKQTSKGGEAKPTLKTLKRICGKKYIYSLVYVQRLYNIHTSLSATFYHGYFYLFYIVYFH